MIFTFRPRRARCWTNSGGGTGFALEVSSSNTSAVVVLGGLKDVEQAKELLRVYLEDARIGDIDDDLLPFEPGAVEVLRDVSDGRPGILLVARANC